VRSPRFCALRSLFLTSDVLNPPQVEFDSPANLIRAGGHFASMVANSPDADELRALAGV
jgi:hypothetical protein